MEEKNKNEECIELRNLKYKTMLLNGVALEENKQSSNINSLINFLENEKNNNKTEQWVKLNKTLKIEKLKKFANDYKIKNNLTEDEESQLVQFFIDCLDRKKLHKVKDVIYDKVTGEIKDIPILIHNKNLNKFTLKNNTKNQLPSSKFLTPKKKNTNTITYKNNSNHNINNIKTKISICDNEEL